MSLPPDVSEMSPESGDSLSMDTMKSSNANSSINMHKITSPYKDAQDLLKNAQAFYEKNDTLKVSWGVNMTKSQFNKANDPAMNNSLLKSIYNAHSANFFVSPIAKQLTTDMPTTIENQFIDQNIPQIVDQNNQPANIPINNANVIVDVEEQRPLNINAQEPDAAVPNYDDVQQVLNDNTNAIRQTYNLNDVTLRNHVRTTIMNAAEQFRRVVNEYLQLAVIPDQFQTPEEQERFQQLTPYYNAIKAESTGSDAPSIATYITSTQTNFLSKILAPKPSSHLSFTEPDFVKSSGPEDIHAPPTSIQLPGDELITYDKPDFTIEKSFEDRINDIIKYINLAVVSGSQSAPVYREIAKQNLDALNQKLQETETPLTQNVLFSQIIEALRQTIDNNPTTVLRNFTSKMIDPFAPYQLQLSNLITNVADDVFNTHVGPSSYLVKDIATTTTMEKQTDKTDPEAADNDVAQTTALVPLTDTTTKQPDELSQELTTAAQLEQPTDYMDQLNKVIENYNKLVQHVQNMPHFHMPTITNPSQIDLLHSITTPSGPIPFVNKEDLFNVVSEFENFNTTAAQIDAQKSMLRMLGSFPVVVALSAGKLSSLLLKTAQEGHHKLDEYGLVGYKKTPPPKFGKFPTLSEMSNIGIIGYKKTVPPQFQPPSLNEIDNYVKDKVGTVMDTAENFVEDSLKSVLQPIFHGKENNGTTLNVVNPNQNRFVNAHAVMMNLVSKVFDHLSNTSNYIVNHPMTHSAIDYISNVQWHDLFSTDWYLNKVNEDDDELTAFLNEQSQFSRRQDFDAMRRLFTIPDENERFYSVLSNQLGYEDEVVKKFLVGKDINDPQVMVALSQLIFNTNQGAFLKMVTDMKDAHFTNVDAEFSATDMNFELAKQILGGVDNARRFAKTGDETALSPQQDEFAYIKMARRPFNTLDSTHVFDDYKMLVDGLLFNCQPKESIQRSVLPFTQTESLTSYSPYLAYNLKLDEKELVPLEQTETIDEPDDVNAPNWPLDIYHNPSKQKSEIVPVSRQIGYQKTLVKQNKSLAIPESTPAIQYDRYLAPPKTQVAKDVSLKISFLDEAKKANPNAKEYFLAFENIIKTLTKHKAYTPKIASRLNKIITFILDKQRLPKLDSEWFYGEVDAATFKDLEPYFNIINNDSWSTYLINLLNTSKVNIFGTLLTLGSAAVMRMMHPGIKGAGLQKPTLKEIKPIHLLRSMAKHYNKINVDKKEEIAPPAKQIGCGNCDSTTNLHYTPSSVTCKSCLNKYDATSDGGAVNEAVPEQEANTKEAMYNKQIKEKEAFNELIKKRKDPIGVLKKIPTLFKVARLKKQYIGEGMEENLKLEDIKDRMANLIAIKHSMPGFMNPEARANLAKMITIVKKNTPVTGNHFNVLPEHYKDPSLIKKHLNKNSIFLNYYNV